MQILIANCMHVGQHKRRWHSYMGHVLCCAGYLCVISDLVVAWGSNVYYITCGHDGYFYTE